MTFENGGNDPEFDSLSTEKQRVEKDGVAVERTPITSYDTADDPYPAVLDNLSDHDRYILKVARLSPGGNYRIGLQVNGLTTGYDYVNSGGGSGGGSFWRLTSDGGSNIQAGEIELTVLSDQITVKWEMGNGRAAGWGENKNFSGPLTEIKFNDFNGGGGTDLRFALIGEDVILP